MSPRNGKLETDDFLSVHEESQKSKAFVRVVEIKKERGKGIAGRLIERQKSANASRFAQQTVREPDVAEGGHTLEVLRLDISVVFVRLIIQ